MIDLLDIQEPEIAKVLATSVDEHGITPMLTAIQHGCRNVVTFLIANFGVDVNLHGTFEWSGTRYYNVSPLCAAIISRQPGIISQFIAIQQGQVIADMEGIKSSTISREDKIDALELMGAAYVFYNINSSTYAISIWKEATRLRHSTVDGEPVIPKVIPQHQSSSLFAKAMGFTSEFATLEHLDQLQAQLNFDFGYPELNLYTQALLVSQRMLHQSDPEQYKKDILGLLYDYAKVFYDERQFNRAISIGMYMMGQFQELEELDGQFTHLVVIKVISILHGSFIGLRDLPSSNRQEFTFDNIMTVLEYILEHNVQLRSVNYRGENGDVLDLMIIDQIDILTELLPRLNEQDSHRFKRTLYHFIRADYRFNRFDQGNLLHLACCVSEKTTKTFLLDVMKLLLELGVDPSATSPNGMTALHVLAKQPWEFWATNITDVIQLLLDSDAHIDQPDDEGITALDLFKLKEKELADNGILNVYLQRLIHKVRPLTCLAAQVVSRHGIPFDDLPSSLISFVNRH
jgi:ankyrin repeat protein